MSRWAVFDLNGTLIDPATVCPLSKSVLSPSHLGVLQEANLLFDDATFERTAASFANPDHIDIVIHNCRWRLNLAEGEPQYRELEARLFERPVITVPTVTIGSDFDGAAADGHAYAEKFSGVYSHRVLDGIGHNVPQEAPGAFTDAILEVGGGLQ